MVGPVLRRPEQGRVSPSHARTVALVAALAGLCVVTSCASSQDADASEVARRFYAAVQDGDGQVACEMLSPAARTELERSSGQACAEAIVDEDLNRAVDVESAQVYGTMAIVHADEDTVFLGRFPSGWQITGVGCRLTHQLDQYDCSVSGG